MLAGHIVVAGIVVFLDVRWYARWLEIDPSSPGWHDKDLFFFGTVLRILMINTLLLLITLLGLQFRKRHRQGQLHNKSVEPIDT